MGSDVSKNIGDLDKIAKDKNTAHQIEACQAVSDFASRDERSRLQLLHRAPLKPLLHMLESRNVEVQTAAAKALGSISLSERGAELVAKSGAVEGLVSLCKTKSTDANFEGASALNNISYMPKLRKILVDSKSVRPLCQLLSARRTDVQVEACNCLARMATVDEETQNKIVEAAVLGPLLAMLSSGNIFCEASAARMLSAVAQQNAENQRRISRAGAVENLVGVLRSSQNSDVQREVIRCLSELILNSENQIRLVQEGVMPMLKERMGSENSDIMYEASRAMVQLVVNAVDAVYFYIMIQEDGLNTLLRQLRVKHLDTRHEAARGIALLAEEPEFKVRIVEEGGLELLRRLVQGDSNKVAVEALRAMANLCMHHKGNKYSLMDEKYLKLVISQLSRADFGVKWQAGRILCNLLVLPEAREQISLEGGAQLLVSLADSDMLELKQVSIAALANLSIYPDFQLRAHKLGVIQVFVDAIGVVTTDIEEEFFEALFKMAASRGRTLKSHAKERVAHVLSVYAESSSRNPDIQVQAVRGLGNLIMLQKNLNRVKGKDIVSTMNRLISKPFPPLQAAVLGFMANFVTQDDMRAEVLQHFKIDSILGTLSQRDESMSSEAARFLANLCVTREMQEKMARMGTVDHLVAMIRQGKDRSKLQGSRALANLAANEENHSRLYAAGALDALISVAKCARVQAQHEAVRAIANLAENAYNRMKIIQKGGLQPLISLSRSKDPVVQYDAVRGMANLGGSSTATKRAVSDAHIVCESVER